jgi:hypothetical protein
MPPPFRHIFVAYPLRFLRLLFNRNVDTTEEQLAQALRSLGPLVAVGRPNERFSTPGAAKIYVDHDSWQRTVLEMIGQSQLVILQPAATEGVWWEVENVFRMVPPRNVLLCLWAVQDGDDLDLTRARLNRILPKPIRCLRPGHAFVWFEGDWTPQVEHLRVASPFLWPFRGTTADLGATLSCFLESHEWATNGAPPRAARAPMPAERPAAYSRLQLWAAALVFLIAQAVVGTAFNFSTAKILAPSPASLLGAKTVGIQGDGYWLEINAGWTPTTAPRVFGVDMKQFACGPNYALVIISYPFGLDLQSFGGERAFLEKVVEEESRESTLTSYRLESVRTEIVNEREWTCGVTTVRQPLESFRREHWLLATDGKAHAALIFACPAGAELDDPVVRSFRASLDSFRLVGPGR